jgi:hypothetical protein
VWRARKESANNIRQGHFEHKQNEQESITEGRSNPSLSHKVMNGMINHTLKLFQEAPFEVWGTLRS